MNVSLRDTRVCVLGRIKGWTKRSLEEHVAAFGSSVSSSPVEGGLALVGKNPSGPKLTRARSLRCTIIEGEDVFVLLNTGSVELVDAPTSSLDVLIGEARALLAAGPDRGSFTGLMALLNTCAPEHLEDMTRYITPQLTGWSVVADTRESSYTHCTSGMMGGITGIASEGAGALRKMPVAWVADLLRDGPSSKHRVCDALSFSRVEVSNTLAARVFDHGPLDHLRVFSLGATNDSSVKKKAFFKKMIRSEALTSVEAFVVHYCDDGGLSLLLQHPECLPNLNSLFLSPDTWMMGRRGAVTHSGVALALAWASRLHTLGVAKLEHVRWLSEHVTELTELSHLVVTNTWDRAKRREDAEMADLFVECARHVTRVTLGFKSLSVLEAHIVALGRRPPEPLDVLDLSCCLERGIVDEDPANLIARAIRDSRLVDTLERVVLNDTYAPLLQELLEHAGLAVDVVTSS